MIAFVLRETARDPAWIIGGIVPQLGGNAGVGSGWLVVEGDESDRSIAALEPEIAVLTNIELDHHASYASEAELRGFFDAWLAGVPHVVRSWELPPVELPLTVPGDHNRQNAAAALAALELAGVPRAEAEVVIVRFTGVGRRLEDRRRLLRRRRVRRLRPQPNQLEATLGPLRTLTEGRLIAVYQPHVVERTRQLHRSPRRSTGTRRRGDRDRHHRRARRAAPRRHGEARRRLLASRRPGRLGTVTGRCREAGPGLGPARRPRDHVRGGGAVENRTRDRGRPAVSISKQRPRGRHSALPPHNDRDGWSLPVVRRASIAGEALERVLVAARTGDLAVAVVGLGSNVLAADEGVDMLVVRLAGERSADRGERPPGRRRSHRCRLPPSCARRGSRRLRVRLRDPGTAGGGVRMNAGAYGSDWSGIVRRALVMTAEGAGWLTPAELGLSYGGFDDRARSDRRGREFQALRAT